MVHFEMGTITQFLSSCYFLMIVIFCKKTFGQQLLGDQCGMNTFTDRLFDLERKLGRIINEQNAKICRLEAIVLSETSHEASWTQFGGSLYHFSRNQTTWSGAQMECHRYGGKMAEIETKEENSFIKMHISSPQLTGDWYWIGGKYNTTGRHIWMWVDMATPLSYTDWYKNQPTLTHEGKPEHCIQLRRGFNFMWNDSECDGLSNFICEVELSCTTSSYT